MASFIDFIKKIFWRNSAKNSNKTAANRLKKLIIHDRMAVSPQCMDAIKRDMVKVLSKYMEIDEKKAQINITSDDFLTSLVADIPITKVKRTGKKNKR